MISIFLQMVSPSLVQVFADSNTMWSFINKAAFDWEKSFIFEPHHWIDLNWV